MIGLLAALLLNQAAPDPLAVCALKLAKSRPNGPVQLVIDSWKDRAPQLAAQAPAKKPAPPDAEREAALRAEAEKYGGYSKHLALVDIVELHLKEGKPDRARQVLAEHEALAAQEKDPSDRAKYLAAEARLHALLGEAPAVRARIAAVQPLLEQVSASVRMDVHEELLAALLALHDDAGSKRELEALIAAAKELAVELKPYNVSTELLVQARSLGYAGHPELGLPLAKASLELGEKNPSLVIDNHDRILVAALEALTLSDHPDGAEPIIRAMKSVNTRVSELARLANHATAKPEILRWARLAAAEATPGADVDDARLLDVVEQLARAGTPKDAEPFLARIGEPLEVAHAQARLSVAYVESDPRRAQALARAALAATKKIDTNGDRMLIADDALEALYLTGAIAEADKLGKGDIEPMLRERYAAEGLAVAGKGDDAVARWKQIGNLDQQVIVLDEIGLKPRFSAGRPAFEKACQALP